MMNIFNITIVFITFFASTLCSSQNDTPERYELLKIFYRMTDSDKNNFEIMYNYAVSNKLYDNYLLHLDYLASHLSISASNKYLTVNDNKYISERIEMIRELVIHYITKGSPHEKSIIYEWISYNHHLITGDMVDHIFASYENETEEIKAKIRSFVSSYFGFRQINRSHYLISNFTNIPMDACNIYWKNNKNKVLEYKNGLYMNGIVGYYFDIEQALNLTTNQYSPAANILTNSRDVD